MTNLYQFNLKELEKRTILEAIRYSKGNLSYAKDLLGVSRPNLYFLIKKHRIDYQDINRIRDFGGREKLKGFRTKNV